MFPGASPYLLRADDKGVKGVKEEKAAKGNRYNHNSANRLCGCGDTWKLLHSPTSEPQYGRHEQD